MVWTALRKGWYGSTLFAQLGYLPVPQNYNKIKKTCDISVDNIILITFEYSSHVQFSEKLLFTNSLYDITQLERSKLKVTHYPYFQIYFSNQLIWEKGDSWNWAKAQQEYNLNRDFIVNLMANKSLLELNGLSLIESTF